MHTIQNRIVSEFIKLVSIDSKTFEEKEMGDYIIQRLNSLGFSVEQDDAGNHLGGNCGNIYGFKDGAIPSSPLLFCVHMDTVEPSCNKQAILGEDGIIRGNGKTVLGADDCSGIVAILQALQSIQDQQCPHRPIEVLFTVAEEVYCRGAALFDFSKLKSKEAYVLDLTGPVGSAAYKAPTILSFTVTVHGKSAHAGFAPESGVHAIAAAAAAISKLDMGRIDDETTLNIGIIDGGLAGNIIPDRCTVTGEIRSYTHQKALDMAAIVEKHFSQSADRFSATVDFNIQVYCDAYETHIAHPVAKRFQQVCDDHGIASSFIKTFGGSDNNHLANHGIYGLVIANAMKRCHSFEEYTTVDELVRITELTYSLMTSTY